VSTHYATVTNWGFVSHTLIALWANCRTISKMVGITKKCRPRPSTPRGRLPGLPLMSVPVADESAACASEATRRDPRRLRSVPVVSIPGQRHRRRTDASDRWDCSPNASDRQRVTRLRWDRTAEPGEGDPCVVRDPGGRAAERLEQGLAAAHRHLARPHRATTRGAGSPAHVGNRTTATRVARWGSNGRPA